LNVNAETGVVSVPDSQPEAVGTTALDCT